MEFPKIHNYKIKCIRCGKTFFTQNLKYNICYECGHTEKKIKGFKMIINNHTFLVTKVIRNSDVYQDKFFYDFEYKHKGSKQKEEFGIYAKNLEEAKKELEKEIKTMTLHWYE